MSVRVDKREHSECQYMYFSWQLAIRIGEIVVNKPEKYVKLYGEHILKLSLDILKNCQIADRINLADEYNQEDYFKKEECLKEAYYLIDPLSTATDIFLEMTKKSEQVKNSKVDKEHLTIGTLCNSLHEEILYTLKEEFGFKERRF